MASDKELSGYLGLKGIVVGIYEDSLEILCEKDFVGGSNFGGLLLTQRGLYTKKSLVYTFESLFNIFVNTKEGQKEEKGVME